MDITIQRIHKNEVSVDGYLSINDTRVCDTAECRETALPAGTYPITLVKCKQYGRRCLCVGDPKCESCVQLDTEMVYSNTVLPRVCPMLKMGNGVVGRHDGSIILGERVGKEEQASSDLSGDREPSPQAPYAPGWGTLIHPKTAYDRVFDRVRKTLERGKKVRLRVV